MSLTFEGMAEKDLSSKLSQYIMSGVMTMDQAQSVAEAVGKELGDLRIGENIRKDLVSIVGVDGYKAKFTPGAVATLLAEQDERRVKAMTEATMSTMGELITQNFGRDVALPYAGGAVAGVPGAIAGWAIGEGSRTQDQPFDPSQTGYFNIWNQFFSGMADQARRNIGSLIELQSSQVAMLLENIPAVGLAYDDLIAKAKTAAEIERLRLERSIVLTKLQQKLDKAREDRVRAIFGSEEGRRNIIRPYQNVRRNVARQEALTENRRQYLRDMQAPRDVFDMFRQIPDRLGGAISLGLSNIMNSHLRIGGQTFGWMTETFPPSFAQMYTSSAFDALKKKFEDTPLAPYIDMAQARFNAEQSPEFALIIAEALANEDFAQSVLPFLATLEDKMAAAVTAGLIKGGTEGSNKAVAILDELIFSFGTPGGMSATGVADLTAAVNSLNPQNIVSLTNLLDNISRANGAGMGVQAAERFAPLIELLGNRGFDKIGGLGGKSIIESILGDKQTMMLLGKNDKALDGIMNFVKFIMENPDVQPELLNELDIEGMIKFGKNLEKFSAKKFAKEVKAVKQSLADLEAPEGLQESFDYITKSLDMLNQIEDPEIRARISAQIDDSMYIALDLLRQVQEMAPGAERDATLQRALNILTDASLKIGSGIQEDFEKKKPTGTGGSKSDPLGDLMRQMRDNISNLAKVGTEIFATGKKAQSTFDKLRNMGIAESVIEYLRSMSPEDALRVGKQVLNDRRKLNTLIALVAQEAVVAAEDAAKTATQQRKFNVKLINSRAMSGMNYIEGMQLMQNPEFVKDMEKASQGPKPQRMMRRVRAAYIQQIRQEQIQMSQMMPQMVTSEIQDIRVQQKAAEQLGAAGLSEQQISAAMGNEAIMSRIITRMRQGKGIGQEVINMARDYANSQKTVFDYINDGVDNMNQALSDMNGILSAASDRIELFSIRPLEEELNRYMKSSAEYSEQQRRLSRSISDIQEKEADLREEQTEKEKDINDYYDSRLEALEKVDKINKQIAQSQQDQLDVASALSRGDIGAAAKAAAQMESRAAQAKRELLIENLREQKQKDIESLRESTEEKIKAITVEVNGDLLKSEEIQKRIDEIDDKIYENSLKEYDLQQKISAEREKQAKIADAQDKLSRGQNLINRLAGLQSIEGNTPEETAAKRASALNLIKAEASALGGPAAENLIKFIDTNMSSLLEGKWSEGFKSTLIGGLSSFASDFTKDFSNVLKTDLKVPAADLIPDGQINLPAENFTLPNIDLTSMFASASTVMTTTLDQMEVRKAEWDKEVTTNNPFDKLISGTKRFKSAIQGLFAPIPKPPGSGGAGAGKPPTTPTPPDPNDENLFGTGLQAGQPYEELKLSMIDKMTPKPLDIKNAISSAVEKALALLPIPGIESFATTAGDFVGKLLRGIESRIPTAITESVLVQNLLAGIRLAITGRKTDVEGLGKDVAGNESGGIIGGLVTGLVTFPRKIVDNIIFAFKNITKSQSPSQDPGIIALGTNIAGGVDGGIIGGIINGFLNLPGAILSTFITNIKSLFSIGEDGKSTNLSIIGVGTGIIGGLFGGLLSAVSGTPLGIFGAFISKLLTEFGIIEDKEAGKTTSKTEIKDVGQGILGGIIGGFNFRVLNPGTLLSSAVSGFASAINGAFDAVKGAFEGIGRTVAGWIMGPINAAKSAAAEFTGQGSYFGGPIKKAFGGQIYRGSREQAPGMAFGGKMKKYAT